MHGRGRPVPWLMSALPWHLLTRSGLCKRREEPCNHSYLLKVSILGHIEDLIRPRRPEKMGICRLARLQSGAKELAFLIV